jgi:hypothetical protein
MAIAIDSTSITDAEAERFWSKVVKTDGCWLWSGTLQSKGYGFFSFRGRMITAHRFSWLLKEGGIPDGLQVLHRCDNKVCVNHDDCLFLGTNLENHQDKARKGRSARFPGESNPSSKITAEVASGIRALNGHLVHASIAEIYGISRSQVGRIMRNEQWR